MSYQVEFSRQTIEQLKQANRQTARIILKWVQNYLEGCEEPRRHGKGFAGRQSFVWRYRIGQYRFMAEIHDDQKKVVLIWLGQGIDQETDLYWF